MRYPSSPNSRKDGSIQSNPAHDLAVRSRALYFFRFVKEQPNPDPKIRSKRGRLLPYSGENSKTGPPAVARLFGGAERDRTDDLLLAKQALSQLSYSPGGTRLVGLDGFEPSTPALSRRCSNRLSYRPTLIVKPLQRLANRRSVRASHAHFHCCYESQPISVGARN